MRARKRLSTLRDTFLREDEKLLFADLRHDRPLYFAMVKKPEPKLTPEMIKRRDELEKHLAAGAKKVIVTVPPKEEIDAMIVAEGVSSAAQARRLTALGVDAVQGSAVGMPELVAA